MTNQEITLDRLELYFLDLPQKIVFKSGIGTRKSKETLIVKWVDRDGRVGYGECSCRPDPYYSDEFLAASLLLIQKFIAPKLNSAQAYAEVLAIFKQIRGWNFTKSAVEAAMFQIAKQLEGDSFSLQHHLQATAIKEVPVGISLGIYEDIGQFKAVIEEAINDGYKRLKFKIAPTVKTQIFDQINPTLFDNNIHVSFDANGSYSASNIKKLGYFVETYSTHIEQPTAPDRFDVLLTAKALFPSLKVCFDEEVKNMGDLVKLKSLGVIDELNLKIGRVGGISNSVELLNYCYAQAIPCWLGGMFETGIGRLQNLELAAFLPNATAHDLSPSSRYFKEDIISPQIEMKNGLIDVANAMKSKVEEKIIEKYTTQKVVIKI